MTDAPTPDDAPDRTPEVPDEATLAEVAEPARVRRAPKIGAFITAGALLGALLGLVLALVAGPGSGLEADGTAFISVLEGQGGARLVCAVAGAVLGGFAGAALAVLADRRSVRRAERERAPRRR
ncbi:histidine kinase [Cellulomonas hominis]|uniref:histidine kinase n=1 Tax=Cellulomonas hominis TaxID=156981 RepID=UPI0014443925|nr:histidine kinase [Cellulomonas hominis]NKY10344.1 histidine kinase [Cellulomonas hominis]